jgi:ribosomal protein S12 methylthiotransferase accessory factor
MKRVRLRQPHDVVFTETGIVLESDIVGTLAITSRDIKTLAAEIVRHLDGSRDLSAVVGEFPAESRPVVSQFLQLLQRAGLLEIVNGDRDPLVARWSWEQQFFDAFSDRADEVLGQLHYARILFVGLEAWGAVAASELAAAGIGVLHIVDDGYVTPFHLLSARLWNQGSIGLSRGGELQQVLAESAPWCHVEVDCCAVSQETLASKLEASWDLVIVAVDHNNIDQLTQIARTIHTSGQVSLYAMIKGVEAMVGPVVIPNKAACWNCVRLRLLANHDRLYPADASRVTHSTDSSAGRTHATLAPMVPLLGHLLALEAIKVVAGYTRSQLVNEILIQNLVTLEAHRHAVVPEPRCEVCGGANSNYPVDKPAIEPPTIHNLEDLRAHFRGWIDPRTGVISDLVLRDQDPTEPRLPVRAHVLMSDFERGIRSSGSFDGIGGKGLTAVEAAIGAFGEAVERYSASYVSRDRLVYSLGEALIGDFLDPETLCLYDKAQYARTGFPFVPFDRSRPHFWVSGSWIDTGTPVWVPALATYYLFPEGWDDLFCQVTSSGLAAGVSHEDAALRAVFELVERDAFMLSWLCQLPARRLIVGNGLHRDAQQILQGLQECGATIEFYLLDVGLSIPTIACIGLGDGERWPGLTVSSAAHLSPRIAASKALLEHGYSGLYLRRSMMEHRHAIPRQPAHVQTFLDHAHYYIPAYRARACDFLRTGVGPPISLEALEEPSDISLVACAERIGASGVRVAVVDVTAPDVATIPFHVVRALGTHIQMLHCGFGMERRANRRLQALLKGPVNRAPHPLC